MGDCSPGQTFCAGNGVQTCGMCGTLGPPVPCVDQSCILGKCQGVCAPGQTQCLGNAVQVCDVTGNWAPWMTCSGSTPNCSNGACVP
jgi:hypothetical protein